ncbi:MAG: hypothetical protein JWN04_5490, partial [Myxococcaceae bacterium]|nr:hypothetical protein [Myxococcaceae bacterium]
LPSMHTTFEKTPWFNAYKGFFAPTLTGHTEEPLVQN